MTQFNKSSITVFLFLFFSLSAMTQKEAVILYNNTPIKVELEGDKIKTIISEVPGHMKGYDTTKKEKVKPVVTAKLDQPSSNGTVVSTTKTDVVDNKPNAAYPIKTSENIYLYYKPNYATLSKEIINDLNKVIARMAEDPNIRISISANRVTGKPTTTKLAQNRLKAAKTYIRIKGIDESRILTELNITDTTNVDQLTLNFLK